MFWFQVKQWNSWGYRCIQLHYLSVSQTTNTEECQGESSSSSKRQSVRERPRSSSRSFDLCKPSSFIRTSTLQGAKTTEASHPAWVWLTRCTINTEQRGKERPHVLDPWSPVSKWEIDQCSGSTVEDLFRCFTNRLGSQCRECIN